jgi:propanol-preferring alcohol dehydrogenase
VGHEAVSIIESLGPDATSFGLKVGDRIGAPLWHGMCLDCVDCKEHGPDFCPTKQVKGLNAPGYFAEYTLVDAASAVVIPKEAMVTASPAALAPLFCAGVTVWDALKRAKLRPTETIAIVGAGGLGQIAARYAQAMGVRVIVLDVQDEQLQRAKANGSADHILNTKGIAPDQLASQVAAVNHGRLADAVVVTSGALPAYGTSWNIVRTEGRVIAVGIPANDLALTMGIFTGRSLQYVIPVSPTLECLYADT